jgi:hypothetical protein
MHRTSDSPTIPWHRETGSTSDWRVAVIGMNAGDTLTAHGTDALHPRDKAAGKQPRRTTQTFNGPGILTLYRAPNGDVRWYSNALETV